MHDVTNQAKNIMNDLPKKRQTFSDGMIFLASKMEIQRFAFSSIFTVTVIAILFLSVARNMVRILKKMARKICFNVQQNFDIFREFHEGVERKTSFTNNSIFDVFREVSYGKKDEKVGRYGKMEGYFKIWL